MSQQNNRQRSGGRNYSSRSTGQRSGASAGSRTSQSYRTGSRQTRRGRKKRGPQYGITKILLGILFAVVAVICVMAAVKTLGGSRAGEAEAGTAAGETELKREVTVDGISITGMSREEARKALEDQFGWEMKVTYKDENYELNNLMDGKIDALLEEIYTGEPKESYTLDTDGLEDAVQAEVEAAAKKWDVAPKNGSISGFDKASGKFTYAGEQNGIVIDRDKLASDISEQLKAKNFQAVLEARGKEVAPKITEAQAKEMYKVIGTYTTTTTANKDRNKNVELAADAINGRILQPGEEFSFNGATGERSLAKGYKPAGAYVNGVLVEEPGGGVCQVSSTLYNAVVFSGLTTTERHAHSYEPAYVTPGEDAMVSYGGPDMKFVNSSSSAIAIRTSFADRTLKISIVGIPILEDGVTLSMTSKKTADLDSPVPEYEENQTIQPGEEKIIQEAKPGSKWVTNLVTKRDGKVVSDELFHNSTYRGKPAKILRNTSGVVVTEADPSGEASDENADTSQKPAEIETPPSQSAEGPGEATAQTTEAATEAPSQGPSPEGGGNVIPPNPFG